MSKGSTIYARVEDEDKAFLKELAGKEAGWSENFIIERMIHHLRDLSTANRYDDIRALLSTTGTGTFFTAGELMEGLAWGQHAFTHKRWGWAIEQYRRLEDQSNKAGALGVWRFAQYQMAYCWLDVGLQLRQVAIQSKSSTNWDALYGAADWALCASIAYNERHSQNPHLGKMNHRNPHPVVVFNIACGWSLRAQYEVERNLGHESPLIIGMRQAVEAEVKAQESKREQANSLDGWRAELAKSNKRLSNFVERKASNLAGKAIDALRNLIQGDSTEPPTDIGFLMRLAREDSDFFVLRSDEHWCNDFNEVLNKSTVGSELNEFEKLKGMITPDVTQRVEALI